MKGLKIEDLWNLYSFTPNEKQREAICHIDGPLFLAAGPGAGKTKVLLWRTVNLIVFHDVNPDEIYLSTFTEKAAKQLKDGLHGLLSSVTAINCTQYDISRMYIGTVHSLCQRLVTDRKVTGDTKRRKAPIVLDELDQYFLLHNRRTFRELLASGDYEDDKQSYGDINKYIKNIRSKSRHDTISNLLAIFNRFSEECLDPHQNIEETQDIELKAILKMYHHYLELLDAEKGITRVDFSLLQKEAYSTLESSSNGQEAFKHIIIDEYQDTNSIQEKIFFYLAKKSTNICVVGDDDQALYRFRGATVENFVQFEKRITKMIQNLTIKRIDLDINYRSAPEIIDLSQKFLNLTEWQNEDDKTIHYRIHDKVIESGRKNISGHISVLKSQQGKPDQVCSEIVSFVRKLKEDGKIEDYSQCAFLFPSIKNNKKVKAFMAEFERAGVPTYAPRATRFLEVEEASAIWGMFLVLFGMPKLGQTGRTGDYKDFKNWLESSKDLAERIITEDEDLQAYIKSVNSRIQRAVDDYRIISEKAQSIGVSPHEDLTKEILLKLIQAVGLSKEAKKSLTNPAFFKAFLKRISFGNYNRVQYAFNRASSLDFSLLDLFYQFNGFEYFQNKYQLAEKGDEGEICNLSLVSQFIARFIDKAGTPIINGELLSTEQFSRLFFNSYTYAIYKLGESEYEDKEDPFPKGRVPFLTIHQSKGLEFPVVILGSLYKRIVKGTPDQKEVIMRELIGSSDESEPLERMAYFDAARVFYVAMTRAQNLLVLPQFKGRGQATQAEFKELLASNPIRHIEDFDGANFPVEKFSSEDIGKAYSYTGDFLNYKRCPRQYMVFKRLEFAPSRSQNMFFGRLIHQTIEDLHHYLIELRESGARIEGVEV